jgi:hypothetical protein
MLHALPNDILEHIVSFLDSTEDRVAVASASSRLRIFMSNPHMWKTVCVRRPGCVSALNFLQHTATACSSLSIASRDPDDIVWLLHGIRRDIPECAIDTIYARVRCNKPTHIPSNFLHFPMAFERLVALRVDFHIDDTEWFEGVDIRLPESPACAQSLRVLIVRDVAVTRKRVGVFFKGAQSLMTALDVARLDVRDSDFLFRVSKTCMPSMKILEYYGEEDDHFLTRFAGWNVKKAYVAITRATHTHRLFRQIAYLRCVDHIEMTVRTRDVVLPMTLFRRRAHIVVNVSKDTRCVSLEFHDDDEEKDSGHRRIVVVKSLVPGGTHLHLVKISVRDVHRVSIHNAHPHCTSVVALI